jgi:hypothetical protein
MIVSLLCAAHRVRFSCNLPCKLTSSFNIYSVLCILFSSLHTPAFQISWSLCIWICLVDLIPQQICGLLLVVVLLFG